MRVKEIEINKIKLHQWIDTHLKEVNLVDLQWMVIYHLKVMDYQVVTECLHQWVHHLNMEAMDKDHLQEWWEATQAPTKIHMADTPLEELVNMDKDLPDNTEWVEVDTVECQIWEWRVDTILIYNNNINSVDLLILDNMELHLKEWALMEVHKTQWIIVEATINHHKWATHINITSLQAMVKQVKIQWDKWEDTVSHLNSIHLLINPDQLHQVLEMLHLQPTSILTMSVQMNTLKIWLQTVFS